MDPTPTQQQVDEVICGDEMAEPSVTILGGNFAFDPTKALMLLNRLPKMLHIRANELAIGSVARRLKLLRRYFLRSS